jgi:hypothetical protein
MPYRRQLLSQRLKRWTHQLRKQIQHQPLYRQQAEQLVQRQRQPPNLLNSRSKRQQQERYLSQRPIQPRLR